MYVDELIDKLAEEFKKYLITHPRSTQTPPTNEDVIETFIGFLEITLMRQGDQ